MRLTAYLSVIVATCMLSGTAGCNTQRPSSIVGAVAVIHPTKGNKAEGVVKFMETAEGVKVTAEIKGLGAKSKHGFHIHEFGDVSKVDGTGTGGHYNPENHEHALPHANMRHAGDLGNLEADENGIARYENTLKNITINGSKNPILGRGVIVHMKEDDGGQPTGNAGARIGQGVIGIAAPAEKK